MQHNGFIFLKLQILFCFRVLRKRPRSANAYLHSEFPCQLLIHGEHNHLNDTATILRYNKISDDTKEKLYQLFMTGHSATSAREALKLELYINYPEDYSMLAADNCNVPSIHAVQGLLKKTCKNMHFPKDGAKMEQHLQILLTKYCEETGGSAKINSFDNHKFVVICSPLMKRAHSLPQSAEVMFVDASRDLDRQKHRVYMFITLTPAGGIPLGCIITDIERKNMFHVALKSLKECFPENSFYGTKNPIVIMMGDDIKEKGTLQEEWSDSTLLLCQYKFLKSVWNWLSQTEHRIQNCDRQEMYFVCKRLVHAENEEVLTIEYENIKKKYENSYPNFVKYVENMRQVEKSWATFYRKNLPILGNNSTNYAEIVFRILNDVIFDKVKAFNLTQLVDFILIRYEDYVERHLLDFAYGRYCTDLIRKYLPMSNGIDVTKIFNSDEDRNIFFVPSETQPETLHIVDAQHGFCTCIHGESRAICSHLSAVMKFFCIEDELFMVTSCTKATMFEVATGMKPPDGWLLPLGILSDVHDTDPDATDTDSFVPCSLSEMNILADQSIETPEQCTEYMTELKILSMDHQEEQKYDIQRLTEEEKNELETHFGRISKSIEENPVVFVPAVRRMLQNIKCFVKTDSSLQSALYNFGRYRSQFSVKQVNTRRKGKRGIKCLGNKRHLQSSKPVGTKKAKSPKDHEYCKP